MSHKYKVANLKTQFAQQKSKQKSMIAAQN